MIKIKQYKQILKQVDKKLWLVLAAALITALYLLSPFNAADDRRQISESLKSVSNGRMAEKYRKTIRQPAKNAYILGARKMADFTDLSSNLAGWKFSVSDIGFNGSYFVIAGGNKLKKYDGSKFNDLSSKIPAFGERGAINAIESNDSYWLIGGMDENFSSVLYKYDGTNFINLSEKVKNYGGGITNIGWNGKYWLISAGASVENPSNSLIKYDGQTFSLVSAIKDIEGISSIAWGGEYWLIGLFGLTSDKLSTVLLKYDGTNLTNMTFAPLKSPAAVTAMAHNGKYWLIAGYNTRDDIMTPFVLRYDGYGFISQNLTKNTKRFIMVNDIDWIGDNWLLVSLNIKKALSKFFPEFSGAGGFNVVYETYDGKSLKSLLIETNNTINAAVGANRKEGYYLVGGATDKSTAGLVKLFFTESKITAPPTAPTTPTPSAPEDNIAAPTLIKKSGGQKVYVVKNGKLAHIPSPQAFKSLNYQWQDVQTISVAEFRGYQRAYLMRKIGGSRVYYITPNGYKKHIPTAEIFTSYGNKWEDVVVVDEEQLNWYPETDLVRLWNGKKVYKIENNKKRWIMSAAAFNRFGYDWNSIVTVNEAEINSYPETEPIN